MSHKKEVWHLGKYGALIIRVWHQQKYLSLQNEIWFWERSNQISKLLGHWPSLGVSVLSDQVATDHGENGSSLLQIMMLCFLSHDRLQFRVILSIISNTFNLYLASPSSTPVICLRWLKTYSDLNICSISCIKKSGAGYSTRKMYVFVLWMLDISPGFLTTRPILVQISFDKCVWDLWEGSSITLRFISI